MKAPALHLIPSTLKAGHTVFKKPIETALKEFTDKEVKRKIVKNREKRRKDWKRISDNFVKAMAG